MEYTHQSLWIIPFIPLPVPMLIGAGLLFFPTATKNLRRRWDFLSILLLGIVILFSVALSIDQINNNKSFIYQYVWSWTINNDLSLEFSPPISNPRFQTFLKCERDAPGQKDYRCKISKGNECFLFCHFSSLFNDRYVKSGSDYTYS